MSEYIHVFNTKTGKVGTTTRFLYEHPFFNPDGLLVEVEPGTKPYVDGMYTSRYEVPTPTADEEESETPEKDKD